MSDEQDLNLEGSIMQPKNRPLDDLDGDNLHVNSEYADDAKMRIKEYDQVKRRSDIALNNGNGTQAESFSVATFNQPPKKVVTSVKNSLNDPKSSSQRR